MQFELILNTSNLRVALEYFNKCNIKGQTAISCMKTLEILNHTSTALLFLAYLMSLAFAKNRTTSNGLIHNLFMILFVDVKKTSYFKMKYVPWAYVEFSKIQNMSTEETMVLVLTTTILRSPCEVDVFKSSTLLKKVLNEHYSSFHACWSW